MGFPVTGQGYNIVAFSFYIGQIFTVHVDEPNGLWRVRRLLHMGFPDHVYIAAYASWQISWRKYTRLGRDHDAACYPKIFRPLFRSATPSRRALLLALRNSLLTATLLTGALESCVAPILILLISMFYKKDEQVCRNFYAVHHHSVLNKDQ